MARTSELSRLLSFRRPRSTSLSLEKVSKTIDLSNEVKSKSYSTSSPPWLKTPSFESPDVDFAYLRKATKTEPLFHQRANKLQNLMWKNGYVLKTEDPEALSYIRARIEIFTVLTGTTFDAFLRKVSRELIKFDNVLLWERRLKPAEMKKLGIDLELKGIGPKGKDGPVLFYEILPIDTIRFKRDNHNNILQWQQIGPGGQTKEFDPSEVMLITKDEDSGDILAYPTVQMVLPDTRILRQLETDASLVAHRLAFPLFKYKVGSPQLEQSIPKKDEDLSGIWYELEGMLLDGTIIMPGTHDFEVVLSDTKLDGVTSMLDYFKNRVIVGLGMSPVHLGDLSSANRSITDRLDIQLYDDVKSYQKVQEEVYTFFVFGQWLLEAGFNLNIGQTKLSLSWVYMVFREIDTDSLIKRENHALAKWVQDGITHAELRAEFGLQPLEDTSDLYSDKIGAITAKYQEMVAQTKAQQTSGGSDQGSDTKTKVKKTHSLESLEEEATTFRALLNIFKEESAPPFVLDKYLSEWDKMQYDVTNYISTIHDLDPDKFSGAELAWAAEEVIVDVINMLRMDLLESMRFGVDRGFDEARDIDPDVTPMRMSVFNKNVYTLLRIASKDMERLMSDLSERVELEILNEDSIPVAVENAFAALAYRLKAIVSSHVVLAENWGVCVVAEHLGYEEVWQESETGCSVCTGGWVQIEDITPKDVPPFSTHPNCGCKVHIKER